MFITKKQLSRRTVLRGAGVSIALPFVEAMLPALCGALGVVFDPAMLRWPAGRRASDGVWGAHWYGRVEQSTGFARYREPGPVPAELEAVVEACMPYYETMRAWRLGPVEAGE